MATKGQDKKYIVVELKTTGQTKEIQKSIKQVVTDLKSYEDKLKNINQQYKDQKTLVNALKASKKMGAIVDPKEIAKEQRALNRLSKEVLVTKTNYDSNKKTFDAYTKSVSENNRVVGQSVKGLKSQQDEMAALTRELLLLTAAWQTLKTVVGFVMTSFIDFEATMMNVNTLLDVQNSTLQQGSINIMKQYGFTIQDTNKALYDAISTAIPAGQAIQFLDEAAQLAVGGVTDLHTAVDGLTSVINAYSLNINEAGRVADAFFRAQKWAKATVAELVDQIGRIAPVASIAGVSYQEMLGAISELTLGGLDARESVTVLRQAISGLIKPAAEAEKALRKYNVPVGIAEVANAGLTYSLEKLMEAYKEYPDIIAEMIPNIRAFTGVTALTAQRLENMRMIIADINGDWGEFSSLNLAVAKQMTTTEMKVKKFKAELTSIGINIGSRFKKPFEWLLANFKALGITLVSVIASMIAFAGTFKLINNAKRIVEQLTVAFTALKSAAGLAAGAISLIVAGITAYLLKAASATDDYRDTLANLGAQIRSTKNAFKLSIDTLEELINKLKTLTPGTDEYNKTLKEKLELINHINETYKDYIENLITEATTLEELEEIRKKANDAIDVAIVLKNRENEVNAALEDWNEKTGKEGKSIEATLADQFEGSNDAIAEFMYQLDLSQQKLNDGIVELYKNGEATDAKMNELRVKMLQDLEAAFKSLFQTNQSDSEMHKMFEQVQLDINDIFVATKDYASELDRINKLTEKYKDLIEAAKKAERETIREHNPDEIMTLPLIGYTGTDTPMMTYDKFVEMTNTLPPEFDFYKKKLMEEYQKMYLELQDVIANGSNELGVPYKDMSAEERKQDKKLTEMEQKLVQKYIEIYKTLKDIEIDYIKQFNFYGKEKLPFTTPLTEEQMKDLKIMIEKWEHDFRKTVIDNNRLMMQLQIQYFEDQVQMYEDGYDKEMALINVNYAKKAALIESNYAKEKETIEKMMDELGLNNLEELPTGGYAEPQKFEARYAERKKFFDMLNELELRYQNQLTQIGIHYTDLRNRLLHQQLEDIKDFTLKYQHESDIILNLDRQIEKNLKEMIKEMYELTLDQTFLQQLPGYANLSHDSVKQLVEMLDQFALSGKSFEDVWNSLADSLGIEGAADAMKNFGSSLLEMSKAWAEFIYQSNYQRKAAKAEVLELIGILTIEQSQEMQRLELDKKLHDNKAGMIEMLSKEMRARNGNAQLTANETKAIEDQVKAYEDLARVLQDIKLRGEAIEARRPSGGVLMGDIYKQQSAEIWANSKTQGWTKEDVESAMKTLEREIPDWARGMTERTLGIVMELADRVTSIIQSTISGVFQVIQENEARQYQRELDKMSDMHDTELDLLKNRLDKQLISEEVYEKKKEQIDRKYRRREEQIKKEQFEKNKKRAVAEAIISGAVAAVKAYYELGPLGGIAGSALVAAETAAQVALIYAQKYKKGGAFVVGGQKHEQGGTKFVGSDGSAFEAERGELLAIVNAQDTAMLNALGIINSLHGTKYGNGGVFRDGGITTRDLQNALSASNNKDIVNAIENMDISVSVEEINKVQKRVAKIKEVSRF